MITLGIDYGKSKVGFALAESDLSEPLTVLHYKDYANLEVQILQLIKKYTVEKVVVGVSEGAMGEECKNFANILKQKLLIPVETFDETLTTFDANSRSLEANLKRKKRREMEDAYAAAIMLQNYIDFEK